MLLQSIYLVLQIEYIQMQVFVLILEVLNIRRNALVLNELSETLVLELALVLELEVACLEGLKGGCEVCLHVLHEGLVSAYYLE